MNDDTRCKLIVLAFVLVLCYATIGLIVQLSHAKICATLGYDATYVGWKLNVSCVRQTQVAVPLLEALEQGNSDG